MVEVEAASGKLFMDNFRTCVNVHGMHGQPTRQFKLAPCPTSEKIEDGMLVELPLSCIPPGPSPCRPSFLALTAHNWLLRYDYDTGQLLQKVYMSPKYRFKRVTWDSEGHSIVLRSTHIKAINAVHARATQELLALAVFSVFPLEFTGMLVITKDIFGKDVVDAQISQGSLITMHAGGTVRLYSFERIKQKFRMYKARLGETCEEIGGETGKMPWGLPCNIKITETPDVLFEVRCTEHSLCLGGIRCHYIITPPKANGNFHIVDMETGKKTAVLESSSDSLEADKCYFHGDGTSRVLHIQHDKLRVLRLHEINHMPDAFQFKEEFSILATEKKQSPVTEQYTSSGRLVRQNIDVCYVAQDTAEESIQCVDYEDELDILAVSTLNQETEPHTASVRLYDNQRGVLHKVVSLQEPWPEYAHHTITVDLDTIVHIVRGSSPKYACYVYKLNRKPQDDETDSGRKISRKRKRTRAQRTLEVPHDDDAEFTQIRSRRSARSRSTRTRSYDRSNVEEEEW